MSKLHTVINTSPWVSLAICGQTEMLPKLYQKILMPSAVRKEILAGGKSQIGIKELKQASWIQAIEIQDPTKVVLLHELDRGEAEVIILAQEQHVKEVIIDERVARMHAQIAGLEVVGTLGLLLRLKKHGHISHIRPLIEKLLQGGMYIRENIITGILHEVGE